VKKLVSPAPDHVAVWDVDPPEVGPRDVLVQVVRSLISPGSELNRVRKLPGDQPDKWPNHDLGYAAAGTIIELGPEVEGFEVGQRVVVVRHHQQLVTSPFAGDPTRATIPIPDEISWDQAPFVMWGRSCLNWTNEAEIRLGDTVAVMGLGLVGLLMAMWCRLRGPGQIIGLDLFEQRRALARKIGVEHVLDPTEPEAVARVRELTRGRGADVTIHCVSGAAVESFDLSQQITRTGGRLVLLGIHSAPLTIRRHEFLHKDLIGGGTRYDYSHDTFQVGLQFLLDGRWPALDIVTHNVPYPQAPEIYEMLNFRPREAGAVLLRWDV
jgi:threonine dehydrogenase-like Zn-dependent dehydrogenase